LACPIILGLWQGKTPRQKGMVEEISSSHSSQEAESEARRNEGQDTPFKGMSEETYFLQPGPTSY
jgi:hypothetical protein